MSINKFEEWRKSKGIESLDGMSAGEVAGIFNEYNHEQRKALSDAMESKASSEQVNALRDEISAMISKQAETLTEIIKTQGLELQRMKDTATKPESAPSLKQLLSDNKDKLTALKQGRTRDNLRLKVAGNMSLANNVTGQIPQAYRLPGWNDIPQREVRFINLLSQGSIDSNIVEWVYMANEDGAAGSTAEGAAKNQIDFDLLLGSERVEKYTAYIKATDEMLDDISFIDNLIQTQLRRKLLQSVESDAYEGNGTSPNLRGVRTVATAWAAGASAASVDEANIVDVLNVGITQIKLAEQPAPDYILMNPQDVLALKQVKVSATDRRYVDMLYMTAEGLSIGGVPIIESTLVTQDEFLIGNSGMQFMLNKGGIDLEIGYDGNDFTTNFKTIRAEWRGVVYVMNNDRTAFVAGDFTTAKAALETI